MRRSVFALILAALAAAAPVLARAEGDAERGLAIAREADRRDSGFGDVTARMTMVLRNRQGDESTRRMRFSAIEMENDGDRTLIVFDSPRDIRGTGLLTYTHKSGPDDQWLYLPALKRVKRIAASNKSGPFVGSEFAYEDMTSQEVEKYTYAYLRDEPCGERVCFVVERRPVDRRSGYGRELVWIDQDTYRFERIDYYDRRNDLMKRLVFSGYRLYLGRFWRAGQLEMRNLQNGKSTRLIFEDYKFRTGLSPNDFTRARLKRLK